MESDRRWNCEEIVNLAFDTAPLIFVPFVMKEFIRQLAFGAGSIFLAPAGMIPKPRFRITVPSPTATQDICYDFSRVAGDFRRSIERVEREGQLELSI